MEKEKQAFLSRWREINGIYQGLLHKKNEIYKEINSINERLKKPKEDDDIAEKLLNGGVSDSNENNLLKANIGALQDELLSIDMTIQSVNSKGGTDYLFRSDQQLKELAQALIPHVMKQAKEDEKRRKEIEKRYEKVIVEIAKLETERREFNNYAEKSSNLARMLGKSTEFPLLEFKGYYEFPKRGVYHHLEEVKNRS